jgi:hypothetical protein
MKKFLLKSFLFGVPLLVIIMGTWMLEGGYSDAFYLRFTTPRQPGLITGNSRAAQGLLPSIFEQHLDSSYQRRIFNYAFTLSNSAYGKVYYNSIKQKLDSSVTNGLFIVSVDPWSISVISDNPDDESTFPEADNFLAKLEDVSSSPNFDYLLNHYPTPYFNILLRRVRPGNLRLHDDGWLEVNVKMDSSSVANRSKGKFRLYAKNAKEFRYSRNRFQYLKKTIELFKRHGDVYLVRLPVHKEILTSENRLMSNFNERMDSLATELQVPYLDLTPLHAQFKYTDGNHVYKSSSRKLSVEIAKWINETKMSAKASQDAIAKTSKY